MSALTHTRAIEVVRRGMAHAEERSVTCCVAVVDAGGNLLAFLAHEAAMLAAREIAMAKAFTALSVRTSTSALAELVLPGGPFYGLNTALGSRPLVTFAGGQVLGSPVVGAVGVSGGTLDEDEEISRTAAAAYR